MTWGAGVLTLVLARDWRYRVGFAGTAVLACVLAVSAARWQGCHAPDAGLLLCERLYGVHLVVSVTLACGLLVVLYRAVDPRLIDTTPHAANRDVPKAAQAVPGVARSDVAVSSVAHAEDRRWLARVRWAAAGVAVAFVITTLVLLVPTVPWLGWQLGRHIGLW
jgi:hypothetical protein